jgi:nitroreductase
MQQSQILNDIIQQRRSVKPNQFKAGEKIPDAIIQQALINATWAPTHGKTEPWYFIIYTSEGIKKLSDFQATQYKVQSGDKFTEAKYLKLKENYLKASHVIAICLKRDPLSKIPQVEEVAAVAASVQNLALTLHAYGYGGYWTTGGVTYYESAKPFFDLGTNDMLMGFFLAGVVAETPSAPVRKAIELKTKWVTQ